MTSIYRTLDLLEQTGMVTYVGAGRQRQVRFRRLRQTMPFVSLLSPEDRARLNARVSQETEP